MAIFRNKYFLQAIILLHSVLHVINHKLREFCVFLFVDFMVIRFAGLIPDHAKLLLAFYLNQERSFGLGLDCLSCPTVLGGGHWLVDHINLNVF